MEYRLDGSVLVRTRKEAEALLSQVKAEFPDIEWQIYRGWVTDSRVHDVGFTIKHGIGVSGRSLMDCRMLACRHYRAKAAISGEGAKE